MAEGSIVTARHLQFGFQRADDSKKVTVWSWANGDVIEIEICLGFLPCFREEYGRYCLDQEKMLWLEAVDDTLSHRRRGCIFCTAARREVEEWPWPAKYQDHSSKQADLCL